jgi:hypothetical protein
MWRAGDQALDVEALVAERGAGLGARERVAEPQLLEVAGELDAPPAAAGGGLQQQRVAVLGGERLGLRERRRSRARGRPAGRHGSRRRARL